MTEPFPEILPTPDGSQVRYRGRFLYPKRPCPETAARASRLSVGEDTLVLVSSPLLGYGLDELRTALPSSSELLLVEADDALLSLTRRETNISVYSLPEAGAFAAGIGERWFLRFRRIQLLSLNRGYALHSTEYRRLLTEYRGRLQRAWQNKMTLIHMGRMWISNLIENCTRLPYSRDISRVRAGKPIAVVGAGPSLDRSVRIIARHRRELFVLCVDTAYRPLIERGIEPDLLCVVEAQHANLQDIVGMPLDHQAVCADLTSHPALVRKCSNVFFFSSSFLDIDLLDRLAETQLRPTAVAPLGSVGATAVALARVISPQPLLLFGLDFAFAHGKTHARGTQRHSMELRSHNRFLGSDASPFTLQARTLASGNPRLPITTSELRTYNQVTAHLARESTAMDFGEAPLPLGRKADNEMLATMFLGTEHSTEGPRSSSTAATSEAGLSAEPAESPLSDRPAWDGDAIEKRERALSFARSEAARLTHLIRCLKNGDWPNAEASLTQLSYLAIDFPEPEPPAPSSAPRLLAAATYYRERWLRAAARLRQNAAMR
jgi:hypothetical protein